MTGPPACCSLNLHKLQNLTKPDQNRNKTAQQGLQNQQNRSSLKENNWTLQLILLGNTGFVGFAALAVRFCYGFVPVLSGSVHGGPPGCSIQASTPFFVNCALRPLTARGRLLASPALLHALRMSLTPAAARRWSTACELVPPRGSHLSRFTV